MAGTYRSRDSSTRVASKIQSIGSSVSRSKGNKKDLKTRRETGISIEKEKGRQARATLRVREGQRRETIKERVKGTKEIINARGKGKASKLSSSAGAKASRENKINNAVKKKYTGTKSKVSKKSRW